MLQVAVEFTAEFSFIFQLVIRAAFSCIANLIGVAINFGSF
jgi:hypothetical protein